MYKIALTLLLLILIYGSCQQIESSYITGTVEGKSKRITLGEETIKLDEEGRFSIRKDLEYSSILNLSIAGSSCDAMVKAQLYNPSH